MVATLQTAAPRGSPQEEPRRARTAMTSAGAWSEQQNAFLINFNLFGLRAALHFNCFRTLCQANQLDGSSSGGMECCPF